MSYLSIVISFAGGLGLFLYGMHIMAAGLQKAAGNKMKRILEILTRNKLLGIIFGALVTAIIQSSSATTVMVVGFVNAGLMNLSQTVGIIMGANIGTTITSWIVSSVEWASFLKPEFFAPVAIAVGVSMMLFVKNNRIQEIGEIIAGFGLLFTGISTMGSSVEPLSGSETFKYLFKEFGSNPILGLLVGAVVTAIIQSSSASVGILQSIALKSGVVSWGSAIYIIMGQNIGTCVTAVLSGMGASKTAKGASYIHLLFNVIGSIIFCIIAFIFFTFINKEIGNAPISITQISIAHTSFNIANTILMYPFGNQLVKLAEMLSNIKSETALEEDMVHLDDRILEAPSIAIQNCIKEIIHLGNMSYGNLKLSTKAIMDRDLENIPKIHEIEKKIDNLQQALTEFMVKLCNTNITEKENNMITSMFHTVNDMERIGDHCENLADIVQFMYDENIEFTSEGKKNIFIMSEATVNCVECSIKALELESPVYAAKTVAGEEEVDRLEKEYRTAHIKRLKNNECQSTSGVVFLDIITNLERVSDHALNVAQNVLANESNKPLSKIKEELA